MERASHRSRAPVCAASRRDPGSVTNATAICCRESAGSRFRLTGSAEASEAIAARSGGRPSQVVKKRGHPDPESATSATATALRNRSTGRGTPLRPRRQGPARRCCCGAKERHPVVAVGHLEQRDIATVAVVDCQGAEKAVRPLFPVLFSFSLYRGSKQPCNRYASSNLIQICE
ncbi:hypothetical protein PR202_ga29624 [Eleusine coracana subsp. coracana]|uniref:Uncharacterized protein n=1 Tax=Eleusine coracana subsp. coracana TaxID=191504 RepID=A0AAV5DMM7_ELECO|nr:hypothetical protein PR202_ga29624 [Eleusine coracana subsp. coracana]